MLKFVALAAGIILFALSAPAGAAQTGKQGLSGKWTWGPETCVHVRFMRSRQTRYAGAPRCRRIRV
jgi:hypothetical protein